MSAAAPGLRQWRTQKRYMRACISFRATGLQPYDENVVITRKTVFANFSAIASFIWFINKFYSFTRFVIAINPNYFAIFWLLLAINWDDFFILRLLLAINRDDFAKIRLLLAVNRDDSKKKRYYFATFASDKSRWLQLFATFASD